jgi:hypothetical protein
MKRSAAGLLVFILAVPVLRAQAPDLDVVQTRRAFVAFAAAVNTGAYDMLDRLLVDDVGLRIDAPQSAFARTAPAKDGPIHIDGRNAVVAYFKRAFADSRLGLVAHQSKQSDVLATELGRLRLEQSPPTLKSTAASALRIEQSESSGRCSLSVCMPAPVRLRAC